MNLLVKSSFALLVCLALRAPLSAQTVIYARQLPKIALRDVAQLDLPRQAPRVRQHKFLPPLQHSVATPAAVTHAVTLLPAPITESLTAPPPVRLGFTSGTSGQVSPADASGAVGPAHVVGAYNTGLVIHSRAGNVLESVSLRDFWAESPILYDQYDPRVVYDAEHDRWTVMAVDREQAILFAVSQTGDPTGVWRRYEVSFDGDYVDFSRMAVTGDSVLLMTCVGPIDFNQTSLILSISKSDLYAGRPGSMPMRQHQFNGNPNVVPVHGESLSAEYVVTLFMPNIHVKRLDVPNDPWRVVAGPSWVFPPSYVLPQLGSSPIFMIPPENIEAAVYRNGSIYSVMTVGTGDSNGVAWTRFDPATLASDWGLIHDPDNGTHYVYPSLAVNANGAMLIGFGTFSETQYPSAAYVYGDMFGRFSAVGTIRAGNSPVTFTDRWGDYTATVTDPVDGTSFWTVQICSNASSWGTVWAKVEQPIARRRAARK